MIRLGFIGCGGINRHHAKAIRQDVPGLEISAAADLSAEARAAFAKENSGAMLFDDYRAMLAEGAIDAVGIGLPTGLHAEAVLAAAAAGKHVFCEKPMAMALADIDRMNASCEGAGVRLMVGQVRRYDADWGTAKRLIESGVIGRPVLWRQTAGGPPPASPWFMDEAMGGGPFMDGAVHNWDFANFVFGKPVEAMGSLMRLQNKSAFDTGAVVVRYAGGDELMLSWSWGLPAGCRSAASHEVLGPKGVIKFPGNFPEEGLGEYDRKTHGAYLLDTGDKKELVTFEKNQMFAEEWKDFRDAILEKREPKSSGRTARSAVAVALAVLEAGGKHRTVEVAP
ncbi:MAG: Gfo/Idh/MocA family oxidoreductase [Spirochaetes bacterium]|nr:Gfo/Idh/MocA family oxidoreductase [Spirochaetota bacterium]